MAASSGRHVLIAIDLSDQSLKAMLWAAHEFYKPGDMLHLVHVNRCQQPQMTIQHNYPGSTYTIPELHPLDEAKHTQQVKDVITSRFTSLLDDLHIPHMLHMYLDTDNAPASAVTATLFKVAREVSAVLIVVAAHNKAYGLNELLLGSVADYCSQHSTWPVMVVRNYNCKAPPLVIPWSSPNSSPVASPTARAALQQLHFKTTSAGGSS